MIRGQHAIFAYGSLASAESAGETLGRDPVDPRPATLRGWRRRFSLIRDNLRCEKTFARTSDGWVPDHILGLNIEPSSAPGEEINGALITTTATELERLDRRELRYDRIEVTDNVAAAGEAPAFARVFTYVAKPENFAAQVPERAVILVAYVDAVELAFDALGPGQLDAYRDSTESCSAERIEANLLTGQIPAGNPRGW
jgi:cation transport regulator ChaC